MYLFKLTLASFPTYYEERLPLTPVSPVDTRKFGKNRALKIHTNGSTNSNLLNQMPQSAFPAMESFVKGMVGSLNSLSQNQMKSAFPTTTYSFESNFPNLDSGFASQLSASVEQKPIEFAEDASNPPEEYFSDPKLFMKWVNT
jgi:hypothetical protein